MRSSSSIDCCVCMYLADGNRVSLMWSPAAICDGCAIVKKRKEKHNGGNKTWLIHDLPIFEKKFLFSFLSIEIDVGEDRANDSFENQFEAPEWKAIGNGWMDVCVCVGAVNLNSLTQKRPRNIAGVPKGRKADANLPGMFKSDMGDVYERERERERASRTQWVVMYIRRDDNVITNQRNASNEGGTGADLDEEKRPGL